MPYARTQYYAPGVIGPNGQFTGLPNSPPPPATGGPTTFDPNPPTGGPVTAGVPAAGSPIGPYQTTGPTFGQFGSGPSTNYPAGTAPNNPYAPRFTGDAGAFLQSLYQARPGFVEQQGQLLRDMGPGLRSSIFAASPELASAADYFSRSFSDPFGGMRETHEDYIRSAQAARGFTGGGSGVVGEEARYLTNFAERRRQELLPQMIGFGNSLLATSGLQGPPDLTLGAIGALALQNRAQTDARDAFNRQSELSQDMYNQYLAGNMGGPSGGTPGGSPYGTGGSTNVMVGGGGAGMGTPDFFERSETEALLARRRAYAQGLIGNVDPNISFFV